MTELIGFSDECDYQGEPLHKFLGTWTPPTDSPFPQNGESLQRGPTIEVGFTVHPLTVGRIIVNVPGRNGEMDGFDQKYKKLGHHIQSSGLAAFVRTDNFFVQGYLPDIKLRAAMQYVMDNAKRICGRADPEVFLMGFSAGAGAIAAVAHEYPMVTRILLGAPAENMPVELIIEGLSKFSGEVYSFVGEDDTTVGKNAAQTFFERATAASHREAFILENCGHWFEGEANGRLLSQFPFYAFSDKEKPDLPSPVGGVKLYD